MAETVPSDERTVSNRQGRIHFTGDKLSRTSGSSDGSNAYSSLGRGAPPSQRRKNLASTGAARPADPIDDIRQRVRSLEGLNGIAGPSRRSNAAVAATGWVTSAGLRGADSSPRGKGSVGPSDGIAALKNSLGSFSNESLAQDDPAIVEDVQRIMRAKARHDARVRSSQSSPTNNTSSYTTGIVPGTNRSSPIPFPPSIRGTLGANAATPVPEADIDFSPSVGNDVALHPVPLSVNDGATLDWSVHDAADTRHERKWSLTVGKRKGKHKSTSPAGVVEQQDSLYTDRLSRIKSRASPRTLKKAQITSDQLSRRYGLLFPSLAAGNKPLDIAQVARWFNMQEPIVRSFLDQSEPLTWLKHLERRQPEVQNRLPWLMTARIVEEYCKAHARNDAAMATIPEDSTITGDMSMLDKSPSWNSQNVVRSRPVSLLSLEAARSRTQSSHAYDVSFEPSVESRRHARGSHSIHSINGSSTGHKAAYMVDSPRSSLSSINLPRLPPHGPSPGHSPSNSLSHRRDFAKRFSGRGHDSDDGRSSARESFERSSISDDAQSRPVSGLHTQKQPKAIMRPSALHVPNRDTGDDDEGGSRHDVKADEDLETELPGSSTAKPFPLDTVKVRPPLEYRRSQTEPNAAVPREGTYLTTPRAMRISLPSSDKRPRLETVPSHQRVANEEGEREAYEKKSRLLEDVSAQNHRLRQLLKRVSGIVNEYHDVQTTVAGLSNGTANWISSDVVDAFSHDPAAVSGTARRLRGWKAVEDIHRRIQRQREVLDLFAQSGADEQSLLPDSGLFDPPVKALATLLEQLESERSDIMARAEDVANLLLRVKESHQPTKQEYNETLAHVSVVYPELSQIAVLEESYKDHYQQLWEFGMDVLTLILDTVTPFWRFYGRTIADDVQAFLVIPWYRNEYTGESKRYPIEHLPRRSFRHWIGLLLFGISSVMLAAAEAKVAILATTRYRIPWLADSSLRWLIIPFFWMGTLGLWFAFLIQCCIVGLEAGVIAWWFGWLIRIFS